MAAAVAGVCSWRGWGETTVLFRAGEQAGQCSDARRNAERQAVEFRVEIGEYRGVVRVPRRVFQRLFPERPIPYRALRRTTSDKPGSRASPSRNCVGASRPKDGKAEISRWDLLMSKARFFTRRQALAVAVEAG
jgi:hypothetical protein